MFGFPDLFQVNPLPKRIIKGFLSWKVNQTSPTLLEFPLVPMHIGYVSGSAAAGYREASCVVLVELFLFLWMHVGCTLEDSGGKKKKYCEHC